MLKGGAAARIVYAVSDLNEILRALIEDSLPSLWVQGEISNFSKPSSGHWYFTLKDEQAQIRCAMFRKTNYYIRPLPQNGDAVLLRAKASIYPGRGELQLIVEHLEPSGTGALLRSFEELKQRLAHEGLFDLAHKRLISLAPRRLGLITSGTGAALHDVLTTLARRWPLAEVHFHAVSVQGTDAPAEIVKALGQLSVDAVVDTVLLVRGGGSIEDLWAFNTEAVARAIRDCSIPVVTGIGHEIDFTIADFAADLRAATPTAAAELATPDRGERENRIDNGISTIEDCMRRHVVSAYDTVLNAEARLQERRPDRRVHQRMQRLDELEERLIKSFVYARLHRARASSMTELRLTRLHPRTRLLPLQQSIDYAETRIHNRWRESISKDAVRLSHSLAILTSFNPQNVLNRGYAIVSDGRGKILNDASSTEIDQTLQIRLARGALSVKIEGKANDFLG